jgi:hypothetical protein
MTAQQGMASHPLSRRDFLLLPLALALAPLARAFAAPETLKGTYTVDAGVLYNTLSFELTGTVQEAVDRAAGRYEITAGGQGPRIANRLESRGILRGGRWVPVQGVSWFQVAGRESRTETAFHYERRQIEYHFRGETFFLRRKRVADDTVVMPQGHVDDVMSAILNFADGLWPAEADGSYRTQVLRRKRPAGEGPDDVQTSYRAELVPFVLRVEADPQTGRPVAHFDISRFSSWAHENRPARITFGENRRPEQITASLVLGSSVNIRLRSTV